MLSVQREIAREITNNLRPTLSGVEQSRMDKQYTANSEAYQLYLKGRFYWNKRTPADFQKAIPFFQQAIEKDPNYALAYSGLADTYALLTAYTNEPPREVMPKAKEAALKALALDDKLAEAHASLGQIAAYYDYDFVTAEREYRRAIELNPNYATAHQWLAEHLAAMKRNDEAMAEIRRALELDPLSVIMNRIYADILVDARRFDEAIAQYHKDNRARTQLSDRRIISSAALTKRRECTIKPSRSTAMSAAFSGMSPEHAGENEGCLQKVRLERIRAIQSWTASAQTTSEASTSAVCDRNFLRAPGSEG